MPLPRGMPDTPMTRKLTKQQREFTDYYLLHRNGAEAYRVAYPKSRKQSAHYCGVEAHRLLKHPLIAPVVAEKSKQIAEIAEKKFGVTAERVLRELHALAFCNAEDYFEWGTRRRPVFNRNGTPCLDADGEQVYEDVQYVYVKPSSELTREQKAAIVGAEEMVSHTGDRLISVKMADKRGALKMLGEHLGLFRNAEAGGGNNLAINIAILPAEAGV